MERLHPALYHGVSRAELTSAVSALASRAPTASDDEMLVGVLRVIAMISMRGCDAHTGAYVWGEGTYPVDSLPLRVWWFDEGVFVVDALPPYRELIGARIDAVNDRAMADVLSSVEPLVPRDNDATVRLLVPRFLLTTQILRGLGIAGPGPVRLTLSQGRLGRNVSIVPVAMREYNGWAGPYGLHLPSDAALTYLSRMDEPLWWTPLGGGMLYVQYNRVDRLPSSKIDDLRAALHASDVVRVVIDVRHNFGGEVSAVDPMVQLFKDPMIDRAGGLYVITGRNTFSAAAMFVARLDAVTSAIVVGEPMAGCPTSYGNARSLLLPYSGIAVGVATLLEVSVDADDKRPTIVPEIAARLTPAGWNAHQDPALAAITSRTR